MDQPETPKVIKKWGIYWHPIESRDISRIMLAAGVIILVLEKFGALQPLLEALAKR